MARDLEIAVLYKVGQDERVAFQVLEDCDLGDYIITDATFGKQKGSSNLFRHVFEFPTYPVKKGDRVILYTKKGKQHQSDDGKKHFFYWNSDHTVWNDERDTVTLIKVSDWQRKSFGEVAYKP